MGSNLRAGDLNTVTGNHSRLCFSPPPCHRLRYKTTVVLPAASTVARPCQAKSPSLRSTLPPTDVRLSQGVVVAAAHLLLGRDQTDPIHRVLSVRGDDRAPPRRLEHEVVAVLEAALVVRVRGVLVNLRENTAARTQSVSAYA